MAVMLTYGPRRVSCPQCDGVHVESMPWVSGKHRLTRAMVVVLATWARILTWKQVAAMFHVAWGRWPMRSRKRKRPGNYVLDIGF